MHVAAVPRLVTPEIMRPAAETPSANATLQPQQAPSQRDLWLRGATDRSTPFVAGGKAIVPSASDGSANVDAPADADDAVEDKPQSSKDENKRRDRRIASQIPATLWCASGRRSLPCTIRDKSSSGARLEFASKNFTDKIGEIAVGDKLSLVFDSSGPECTSVACVVAWTAGRSCGVRFFGKFSQIPRKAPPPGKLTPEKTAPVEATKRLFSTGAWRRPLSQAD